MFGEPEFGLQHSLLTPSQYLINSCIELSLKVYVFKKKKKAFIPGIYYPIIPAFIPGIMTVESAEKAESTTAVQYINQGVLLMKLMIALFF